MILVGQYDSPFVRRVAVTLHHYHMPFERNPLSVFSNMEAMSAINRLADRKPLRVLANVPPKDKAGRILRDLFHSYVAEPGQLPPRTQEQIERDGVYRVICDYIAGMTDRFAVDEHGKLFDPTVRV